MKLLIFIIAIFIIFQSKCIKEKNVDCFPQVHLTVKNLDSNSYVIKFQDKHTNPNTKIEMQDSILLLNEYEEKMNIINYDWRQLEYCHFSTEFDYYSFQHVVISIYKEVLIIDEFNYYPWDTTKAYIFDHDRVHNMHDTLTIPFGWKGFN